jgi:hypothetical protein
LLLEWSLVSRVNPLRLFLCDLGLTLDEVNSSNFDWPIAAATAHVKQVSVLPRIINIPILAAHVHLAIVAAPLFLEHGEIVETDPASRILEKLSHELSVENLFAHRPLPFTTFAERLFLYSMPTNPPRPLRRDQVRQLIQASIADVVIKPIRRKPTQPTTLHNALLVNLGRTGLRIALSLHSRLRARSSRCLS